jgi:hypothetical protein
MEQLAKPGCVWLTEETFKLARGLLRTLRVGPTKVKGVTELIDVHELQGISVLTRFQANALRGLSTLAGRASTLAQLEAAFAAACAGECRVAVLFGEPGVGKSRLCYELLQRAGSKLRVLEASCLSYLSTRPHRRRRRGSADPRQDRALHARAGRRLRAGAARGARVVRSARL